MEEKIIEVKDLTREFESVKGWLKRTKKKVNALNGVSFDIKKGEIFGLLGPNGAGKTTTIKILSTLLAPTSGTCKVLGLDTYGDEKKIRPRINFIFGGELGVYRRISARDNLVYFSNLYKIDANKRDEKINELLELVGLSDKADLKVETFSKGMIQRLQVARGLVNDPEIIFLDEPSIGLDPVGARDLRNLIKKLKAQGKTILLTTHYMHEADELCDRIAIINGGQIIEIDTSENIKKKAQNYSVLEISTFDLYETQQLEQIESIEGVDAISVGKSDNRQILKIQYISGKDISHRVFEIIQDIKIESINTREATLEDAYIKLIGKKQEKSITC